MQDIKVCKFFPFTCNCIFRHKKFKIQIRCPTLICHEQCLNFMLIYMTASYVHYVLFYLKLFAEDFIQAMICENIFIASPAENQGPITGRNEILLHKFKECQIG